MLAFLKSFQFAFQGLRFAWRERNFRVQFGFGWAVVALGFLLNITAAEWVAITITIGLVLGFEVMNSAIENLVNFVSPEYHPLAGKIKDLAAGAVLVLGFASIVVGLIIFVPYLIKFVE